MQVATDFKVAEVNVFNEGNVGAIEGEIFLQSPSVANGKPKKNTEENQFTKEELSDSQEEKGDMITDKNILVQVNSVQNARVVIQTTDLAEGSSMDIRKLGEVCKIEENMDNVSSTKTTSIDQDFGERSFEGEDKNQKTCSSSVGMEMDPETLQLCQDIEDKKDKGDEMLSDGATDVCTSNETTCENNQKIDEATESGEASKDKLGSLSVTALIKETSSAKAGLDNLETIKEESETRLNEVLTIKENQNEILENIATADSNLSTTDKDNFDTFKEESGTGLNGILIIKENQNEILENIARADSSLSTTDKVDENPKPKADVSSKEPEESKDLAPIEALTMECEHEGIKAVIVEDNITAEEQEQIETSKQEEQLEQSFMQNTKPTEKLESPLDVASEGIETTTPDEYTETITTIEDKNIS